MTNTLHATIKFIIIVTYISITSCQYNKYDVSSTNQINNPTPTLFGTPIDLQIVPTDMPTPAPVKVSNICVFPFSDPSKNNTLEAAVYKFEWNSSLENQVINTRDGQINIEGTTNLQSGVRNLILLHNGIIPATLQLSSRIEPHSHIIYDTSTNTSEIRNNNGDILYQIIYDPIGDIGDSKSSLDITKIERQYAENGGYIVRVSLDNINNTIIESSFENIELQIGLERYAHRVLVGGKIVNLKYDADGNYIKWNGTVVSQGNTITWAIDNNTEGNFNVKTATDIRQVDKTNFYDTKKMLALWTTSQTSCIP